MKELNEMIENLRKMGATDEDIKELYKIALETADKIISRQ